MWRLLVNVALLASGVLLGLYCLLLLLDRSRAGGDTFITLNGKRVDAQLVGPILLPVALAVIAYAIWLLSRRRKSHFANPS